MKSFARFAVVLLASALSAPAARAADRFVVVPFNWLKFEGAPPAVVDPSAMFEHFGITRSIDARPYVVVDGALDAYLEFEPSEGWDGGRGEARGLAVHLAREQPIRGRVFAPKAGLDGIDVHPFTVETPEDDGGSEVRFYRVMEAHYRRLANRSLPGAAWFRHQMRVAQDRRAELTKTDAPGANSDAPAEISFEVTLGDEPTPFDLAPATDGSVDETFDLFTGARALAENLDIHRGLRNLKNEPLTVDVATIEGVTTRAMDWKALVKDMKPELDALARSIPGDQHGIFFPSFDAMVRVFDEIDGAGTPVLQFTDVRAQDQRTKDRYQTQLCMPLSSVARLLGPAIVESVAITGSDPYLPSGTDLALLFQCKQPAVLESYLALRQGEAKQAGAKAVDGTVGSTKYTGVRTDDRRVSSYVARFDDTLVVTNSPVQLERIANARANAATALASADEYVWFRDRYKKSDAKESAFVVLTDATIRRWASPRERIGNSRRVRAAAAMAEIQAGAMDALVRGTISDGASAADPELPFSSDFVWTKRGVFSPTFGSLAFLTPLSEISVDKVGESEKRGYETFRRNFQNLWANFFDPIALRFAFDDAKLGADVTVMPLAATTDYREFANWTRGGKLAPTSGDPHTGALLHFAMGLGSNSELSRMFTSDGNPFARQFGADPLGWIGGGVALYADDDPFWKELDAASERFDFLGDNFYRLPIAIHVDVKDPLKLAGFLTSLRAMSDQSAPGLVIWETKTWNEQSYVKISSQPGVSEVADKAAAYYAAMPDAFVLTLREDLLQRAIDRRIARKAGQRDPESEKPWLGESVALRIEPSALNMIGRLSSDEIRKESQRAAWSALPILTEWKRRYPDQDPVELHERLWNVKLVSPGGGAFVWSDARQTMEASDYGSPGAPIDGPALPRALEEITRAEFGLTFENEGLRARAELSRKQE